MKSMYVYIALVIVLALGLVFARNNASITTENPEKATAFDGFAQCLADAGAKFYGAYWCPHCQAQKRLLENSKKLPYIECSTPDGNGRTQICVENDIQSYPTWIFNDGSRVDGEMTLEELSEKTSCPVPTTAS